MPLPGSRTAATRPLAQLLLAHGPRIATWVLALALGVQAALIVTDLQAASANAGRTSAPAPAPPQPRVNVAAIANAHLFGSAAGAAAARMPRTRRRPACRWC